jgi:hypothetical protein
MIIEETTKRNCCNWAKDFKPYKGTFTLAKDILVHERSVCFCVHCGTIWVAHEYKNDIGEYCTNYLRYSLDGDIVSELSAGIERRGL